MITGAIIGFIGAGAIGAFMGTNNGAPWLTMILGMTASAVSMLICYGVGLP